MADKAEELVEKIGTDEAVRLAAIAAYQDDRFRLCLKLLDDHRALFAQRRLPDDLRRVQAFCQSAVGVLPEAIAEAEALVDDSPTTPNMLALARLYFSEGDLKSLTVISRRLNDAPDLSPEHSLELSRLVQFEDQRLAAELWRNAISGSLPDSLVSAAVTLGFQLNLEQELSALMARMGELASWGEEGIELRNAADIFPFFEEHQRQMTELEELYRSGKAPTHLIAEQANRPLSELYHGVLSRNEDRRLRWSSRLCSSGPADEDLQPASPTCWPGGASTWTSRRCSWPRISTCSQRWKAPSVRCESRLT